LRHARDSPTTAGKFYVCPAEPTRVLIRFTLAVTGGSSRSAASPVQDSQGAKSIPPARPALALVDLDRHPAGVPGLERPPSVAVAFRRHQVDRLGHTIVRLGTGPAQVLEPAEHVVMPPRREGEACPCGAALSIPLDRLAGRSPAPEAS